VSETPKQPSPPAPLPTAGEGGGHNYSPSPVARERGLGGEGDLGIRFDDRGLAPVVVQSADDDAVLLLAYMNQEALQETLRTGRAHFWSRSRGKLWRKGETSGREQVVESLHINCEDNSLLLRVHQQGDAACHTGHPTCYYRRLDSDGAWQTMQERVFNPDEVYRSVDSGQ